jgi:PIN domain nuclease of toxin-antitoxin system
MNILLDTHYLLWSLADSSKLSAKEKEIILSKETDIIISSVSLWEISLKYALNKISFETITIEDILDAITVSGYHLVVLEPKEALSFDTLPVFKHKDPFDRMLIWQSICNSFYFMTRDKNLNQYTTLGLKLIEL